MLTRIHQGPTPSLAGDSQCMATVIMWRTAYPSFPAAFMARTPSRNHCAPAAPSTLAPTFSAALPATYRLPRGSSSLPKDIVDKEQRRRLIQATAIAVVKKGYAGATVADIIAIAGVSRSTFYALFKDKEDCFLYGLRKLADAQMAEVEAEYQRAGPRPEVLLAALSAYLRRINADLNLSQAFIAEAQAATPNIRQVLEQALERFQAGLENWLAEVRSQSGEIAACTPTRISLVMNAFKGHIISRVRLGRRFDDAEVLDIYRFTLSSFGLHEWADAPGGSHSGAMQ